MPASSPEIDKKTQYFLNIIIDNTVNASRSNHLKFQAYEVAYRWWLLTRALTMLRQTFTSYLAYGNCRDSLHVLNVLFMWNVNFQEKNPILSIEKLMPLVLASNAVILQHFIIQFWLCYLSNSNLWEVKNKRQFQTFGYKSGCGHLRRGSNYSDFTWKLWVFWKLVAQERKYLIN